MTRIEPTPEDHEAARRELDRDHGERAREIFYNLEVKRQMRLRLRREAEERRGRRRGILRRLVPLRRG